MKIRMNPMCSIYTAELLAIKTALYGIQGSNASYLVCCDSMSSLQAISSYSPTHPLVQEIQCILLSLSKKGINVKFIWVPGHVGITGNERADAAAKEALNGGDISRTLLPADDLRCTLRNLCLKQWKDTWSQQDSNKLRTIKADTLAWPTSVRKSRREEVVITRVRIGHCFLTHSYLFTEEKIQPRCDDCDSPLTIRHLLTECEVYRATRERLNVRGTLGQVLGNDPKMIERMLMFLKKTSLFEKI
jgi:hypothetical protein